MGIFKKKQKKEQKENNLEEEKVKVIGRIISEYKKLGYKDKQIRKYFINKGYEKQFLNQIFREMKGGKNRMVNKTYEDEEEEDEEEDEEEFDDEEQEQEQQRPMKKKVEVKVPKKENKPSTVPQISANDLVPSIQNHEDRINHIESLLFRAGIR